MRLGLQSSSAVARRCPCVRLEDDVPRGRAHPLKTIFLISSTHPCMHAVLVYLYMYMIVLNLDFLVITVMYMYMYNPVISRLILRISHCEDVKPSMYVRTVYQHTSHDTLIESRDYYY